MSQDLVDSVSSYQYNFVQLLLSVWSHPRSIFGKNLSSLVSKNVCILNYFLIVVFFSFFILCYILVFHMVFEPSSNCCNLLQNTNFPRNSLHRISLDVSPGNSYKWSFFIEKEKKGKQRLIWIEALWISNAD